MSTLTLLGTGTCEIEPERRALLAAAQELVLAEAERELARGDARGR